MISMLFGTARGTIQRFWRRHVLKRRIGRQHLLRALFEQGEMVPPKTGPAQDRCPPVPVADILDMRSWNRRQLQREIRRAEREGEVVLLPNDTIKLTPTGLVAARKMAHEHRLWEIYLITHAEIAPSKVDRDADMIEHILQPSMIAELERVLEQQMQPGAFPASPHPLGLNESSSSTQADELGSRSSEGGRS
jgi:manganese/zinc/iron transport system permease protein